jgi:hypothetical protein
MRSSWQELYVERARIEKAFFGSPETPEELKHDELKQANFLFNEAKEQRYHSTADPSTALQKLVFAIVLLSIVGEKCECTASSDSPPRVPVRVSIAHVSARVCRRD